MEIRIFVAIFVFWDIYSVFGHYDDSFGQKRDSFSTSSHVSRTIRSQDDFVNTTIDQMLFRGFGHKEYEVESDYTFAELDMIVERDHFDRKSSGHMRTIVDKDKTKRWHQNIPYRIEDDIEDIQKVYILLAMDEWERFSCIDFFPASDFDYNLIVFKLSMEHENMCTSYVGKKQGPQEIVLGKNCFKTEIITHEIGHALGFYHEHNRSDRDDYIKINYENILDGTEDSFVKREENSYIDFNQPYDYMSIMHYGQYFFSKNKSDKLITIETKDPEFQNKIGMVKHPSFLDYKTVTDMYNCAADCAIDRCPKDGFLGKNCNCFCKGKSDEEPVTSCFQKDECSTPSVNKYLFDVMDKENKSLVNMNRTSFPDATVLNLFSTNWNCSTSSQLKCENGKWNGRITECPIELELETIHCTEGIVEVVLNDVNRGYICNDDWDDNDATVACKMLGFAQGLARFETTTNINESLPILLDNVHCSGKERSLAKCKHNGWGNHNCKYSEVASVKCFKYSLNDNVDFSRNLECGKIKPERKKRSLRITGGNVAGRGMHPWQVQIQRKIGSWKHWCGGTILDREWILSAAHCFDDFKIRYNNTIVKFKYEDIQVIAGQHDIKKHDEYEKKFDIEYIVKHWNYSVIGRNYAENDIALLKIKSDNGITFNDYIQPACLPTEDDLPPSETKCHVSGWGLLSESGEVSKKLRAVEVNIIPLKKCKESYYRIPIVFEKLFCAGDNNGGKDACKGDSGGPLICEVNDYNTVIGIISSGNGCGRAGFPGVYMNVPMFLSWIKEQISNHPLTGSGKVNDDASYTKSILRHTRRPLISGYYFVTAPNVLRYNQDETVVVSVFGLIDAVVKVWLEHVDKQFSEKTVTVKDEKTPVYIFLKVTEKDILNTVTEEKARTVNLCAEWKGVKQKREILLSYDSGYLITQTDKPIYTPYERVKIRTLALDESLKAVDGWQVGIDVVVSIFMS